MAESMLDQQSGTPRYAVRRTNIQNLVSASLVGRGFAHPITPGNRLALSPNYTSSRIEGDSWNTIGISTRSSILKIQRGIAPPLKRPPTCAADHTQKLRIRAPSPYTPPIPALMHTQTSQQKRAWDLISFIRQGTFSLSYNRA